MPDHMIAPPVNSPSINGGPAPCGGCRGAKPPSPEEAKKTLGIISMLAAKTGKQVDDNVRKMRMAVCTNCHEVERVRKGEKASRLFRVKDGHKYCGAPRLSDITKIYRDEADVGCGCDLDDKVRWDRAQCPRGHWGPGALMGNQFRIEYHPIKVLKDVIDVQLHFQSGQDTDLTGIGDTVSMLPVLPALARRYPWARVRARAIGWRVGWAKLGWSDTKASELWDDTGEFTIKLTPERLPFLDRWCEDHVPSVGRQHYHARAAGLNPSELRHDNGIGPDAEDDKWGAEQFASHKAAGKKVVCIAPFANSITRTWPLFKWVELAQALERAGHFVWLIDSNEPDRTKFIPLVRFWGWGPGKVAALLKHTDVVIGNDSGMAHLAGVMNRPAVAICGPSPGKVAYGWYKSVKVVQSDASCAGCNWNGDKYRYACNFGCDAIWRVTAEQVLRAAQEQLGR